MSLKSFHLVFVTFSILLFAGFGYWAMDRYREVGEAGMLVACVGSYLACPAMFIYARWFLRKLQNVSYL